MRYQNKQYTFRSKNSQRGFIKFLLFIAAIFGILSFFGYTPQVIYDEAIKPYVQKFEGAKAQADKFKTDSEARDATYQEYIDEI